MIGPCAVRKPSPIGYRSSTFQSFLHFRLKDDSTSLFKSITLW